MHVQHVQPHRAGFDLPRLAVRRRKPLLPRRRSLFPTHPLFSLFTCDACEAWRGHDFANRQDPPAKDGETWRRCKYETGHHRSTAHTARHPIETRRIGGKAGRSRYACRFGNDVRPFEHVTHAWSTHRPSAWPYRVWALPNYPLALASPFPIQHSRITGSTSRVSRFR